MATDTTQPEPFDSSSVLMATAAVISGALLLRAWPKGAPDSVALALCFAFWYVGNAFYNQYNTLALAAVGGKYGGLTMTVSTMQLGVCTLYALVLWLARFNPIKLCGLQMPEEMRFPKMTLGDVVATAPVGLCSAAAHSAGVFCLGADPLFGQIVKAGEPVLSAFVNTVFYGKRPSLPKLGCLCFIVGGVAFASLKKNAQTGAYNLKFDERALLFGMIGNAFAAFKGSETKKLMTKPGLKERTGGVANQFAVTECLAFLISLPVMLATEGHKWGEFVYLLQHSRELQVGLGRSLPARTRLPHESPARPSAALARRAFPRRWGCSSRA